MIGTATQLIAGILRSLADGLEHEAQAPRPEPVPVVLHVQQLTIEAGAQPDTDTGRSIATRARELAGFRPRV